MTVSPSQLQLLADLGIPVWLKRFDDEPVRKDQPESLPHAAIELPQQASLLVLPASDLVDEQRQLLEAMLRAIGLDSSTVAVLDVQQFTALLPRLRSDRRVLLMLETLPEALMEYGLRADAPELIVLDNGARIITCHGLDSLLGNATLKAHAWRALKLYDKAP